MVHGDSAGSLGPFTAAWSGETLVGEGQHVEGGVRAGTSAVARHDLRRQSHRRLVSALDIVPTFLELAGVGAAGCTLDGRSAVALLMAAAPAASDGRVLFLYASYA